MVKKMEELQALASDISKHLKVLVVSDGTERIVWQENTPKELQEWFQGVTGKYDDYNFSDLDEYYTVLDILSDIIIDSYVTTLEELEEALYTHEWSYDYTGELLEWAKNKVDDVNEALSNGCTDILGAIRQAMNDTRLIMANDFLSAMQDKVKIGIK